MRPAPLRGLLEEASGRDRAGRVVRIVDPQDRRAGPDVARYPVEIGQEHPVLFERRSHDLATGEARASLGDRIPRGRRDHHVLSPGRIEDELREREHDLLRPEDREDLRIGIHPGLEPSLDPCRDRVAELRQPGGPWVARHGFERIDEGVADERRRLLTGVTDAEVDQLAALPPRLCRASIELLEGVRRDALHPG